MFFKIERILKRTDDIANILRIITNFRRIET
jgi:hypothetical protein